MTQKISWSDFEKIDLRIGTITQVEDFPEARSAAYKLWVDLGVELGVKKSSAQITELYSKDQLIGKQVLCVCNFPAKQVGPLMSEILVTGFHTENGVSLASPDHAVTNGSRLV